MNRFATNILARTRKANAKGVGYVLGAGYRKQYFTEKDRLVESGKLIEKKDGLHATVQTRGARKEKPARKVRAIKSAPVTPAPVTPAVEPVQAPLLGPVNTSAV
jgi:hypothetical protein